MTPPGTRSEEVPATYKTVTERVMVKPGSWKVEDIPASYKTVTRRVLTEPGRWEWRRNSNNIVPEDDSYVMARAYHEGVMRRLGLAPARTNLTGLDRETAMAIHRELSSDYRPSPETLTSKVTFETVRPNARIMVQSFSGTPARKSDGLTNAGASFELDLGVYEVWTTRAGRGVTSSKDVHVIVDATHKIHVDEDKFQAPPQP